MKRDLSKPLANTWPDDGGGIKFPKKTNLGESWEAKKRPDINYWDPTGSNIKNINKKIRTGELKQRDAKALKVSLLGEAGFKKKYGKPIGYDTKKAIAAAFKGPAKTGLESGTAKKAQCKSGKCTGHNTDF